jgi:hypothetical protein
VAAGFHKPFEQEAVYNNYKHTHKSNRHCYSCAC